MIKGSVQQEDITFVNIYASSIGATKHLKQILTDLKGDTDNNTIIAGGFNIPFTSMHRSSRQKVSEETSTLQYTLDHIVLIYINRIFHPKAAEYKFFSSAHGTFSRIDDMLSDKTSPNKFKIKITSSIFSNHNGMKLDINYRHTLEILWVQFQMTAIKQISQ